ncbi:spore germination protein [Sulfobacillus harzensis]|uniref:Spore germination protein n=1 Tax=Sulfobacillus harzensis TaxID=2729629 RepID=A0A7Y0L702_9FIRM|nr:spore germination protein [Sulfobacillus harzensis]NMP24097.1 spore germination protein [Sulfobacillus harzensis]
MKKPTWEPIAEELLVALDAWLPSLKMKVAQQALDKGDLAVLERLLKEKQKVAPDLVVELLPESSGSLLMVYIDGLVDSERLTTITTTSGSVVEAFARSGASSKKVGQWDEVVTSFLSGEVALLRQTVPGALLVDLQKSPHRAVDIPHTEQSIRGPQEAFVETSTIKLAQIRRRLPAPNLAVETIPIGRRAPVPCHVVYIDGLASRTVVDTVRRRLQALDLDTATNATRIGSLIRDHSWALFPTVRYSERVDLVTLHLQSGKVAILVAGDPFVITVPATLADFYRTTADYSTTWYDASFVRMIRWLAWGFGIFLPGLYIALTEVNPDLISPSLFDIVSGSHTGLPFTPFVEVLVMILVIEILREAALRLPTILASTIGTVGAIVVGTSVVKAGFVSAQIIVVMTFTALSLFSGPAYELLSSWRIMNWLMLLSAFLLGVYGMLVSTLWLSVELVSLTSFGVPYFVPMSPWRPKDWGDYLWRAPWKRLIRRTTDSRGQDLRWMDS